VSDTQGKTDEPTDPTRDRVYQLTVKAIATLDREMPEVRDLDVGEQCALLLSIAAANIALVYRLSPRGRTRADILASAAEGAELWFDLIVEGDKRAAGQLLQTIVDAVAKARAGQAQL